VDIKVFIMFGVRADGSDDHDLVLDKSDCKATVGEHYDISVDYNKFM